MSNLVPLHNLGIVELDRVVANLYAKNLISKDDIKEFINVLKDMLEKLPEQEEKFLH